MESTSNPPPGAVWSLCRIPSVRTMPGSGIFALSAVTPVQVTIEYSRFDNNAVGVSAQGLGTGFQLVRHKKQRGGGNSQVGFQAKANAGSAVVSIANSTAGNNATGCRLGVGPPVEHSACRGFSFLNCDRAFDEHERHHFFFRK